MTPEIELELMTADPIELEVASDQEDLTLEAQAYVEGSGDGLTEEVKQALLQMAEHVAYIDEHGQDYYQDLYDALYPPRALVYISVVYDPGTAVIYESTTLDSLKQYVTVTAHYDDRTTEIIASEDYTLSGTLTVGTSVVTAEYRSKTKSFSVDVAETPTLSSITAVFTQGAAVIYTTDSLDTLKQYLAVTANYSDGSTVALADSDYTLSGTLAEGTSTITVGYEGKNTTFNVTVTEKILPDGYTPALFVSYPNTTTSSARVGTGFTPSANGVIKIRAGIMPTDVVSTDANYFVGINSGAGSGQTVGCSLGISKPGTQVFAFNGVLARLYDSDGESLLNHKLELEATFTSTSSTVTDGTNTGSATGTGRAHAQPIYLWGVKTLSAATMFSVARGRIYYVQVEDDGVLVLDLIPCTRDSDGQAGFYNRAHENGYGYEFVTATTLVAGYTE